MIEYVVYVNHPNNKALIHSATCGFYIHRKAENLRTGYWKAFETRKDAETFANKTGKQKVRPCKTCCKKF